MRLASRPAPPCCAPAPLPPSCITTTVHGAVPTFTTVQKKHVTYTVGHAQARFIRMKSISKKRAPTIVNLTVKRRYLTEREVERLMDCARKHGRYGHRDATMILVAYRHGLRASEVCDPAMAADRAIRGSPACAPRQETGLPAYIRSTVTRYVLFVSYAATTSKMPTYSFPISPIGFHRLIQRVGEAAKMPFSIHPHMLRHACGFKLANDGHDTRALQHYLGHKNIQHTVRYTEMAPDRFKDFWRG